MTIETIEFNYINGHWTPSRGETWDDVICPTTEQPIASVRSSSKTDVDAAVKAAKESFPSFSVTSAADRISLLTNILHEYQARREEFATTLTKEMGAPISLSRTAQTAMGTAHLQRAIDVLRETSNEEHRGNSLVVRQPAGVAALITPWNWPINQVFTKVASALAAGCTMILKPSEVAPLDAILFAEVLEKAGVPAGVFNLVTGQGPTVGEHLTRHADVDVISFTGSTRAGREISKAAAETIKVVHLELGGKSPDVILDDADFGTAVAGGIEACYRNAGQSCSVATRMIVPRKNLEEIVELAKAEAEAYVIGDPMDERTTLGPLVNAKQFDHVQKLIRSGIDQGARLVTGGVGKPEGHTTGYFCKPTVFADVDMSMTVAQQEVFGPVLCILPCDTEEEAVRIANDTQYGLAGVVQSTNRERAMGVARRLRAGHVYINHEMSDYAAVPFGGWKQSGSGYEHDRWGMQGFQLIKSILGATA